MDRTFERDRPPLTPWAWLAAAGLVALQLALAGRYGIFRDEFYYLMCADHLAWGYVDHPPLSVALLAAWRALWGDGVLALRVPPALAVGWVALGGALLAREMRGGAAAQALAAVAAGLMPATLALGDFYSLNAFDMGWWVLAVWIACRLLDTDAARWWLALPPVLALGVLNKYSVVFLGVGLLAGLLVSPRRRGLVRRPFLAGAALAVLMLVPHLFWQMRQGWPTLEFMRNVLEHKNAALGPAGFWSEQLLMAHPLYAPLWLGGLVALLAQPRLRTWRPLGVAFLVVGLWLTTQNAKPYYLAPAYPMLLAAGATAVGAWAASHRRVRRVLVPGLAVAALLAGLAVAPLAIPLLPVGRYIAYEQALGLRPRNMERSTLGALPQHFADRFGWRELAQVVARVHAGLPADERGRCLIIAGNYGECGAINYHGRRLGLPPAVSGHNSCWTWWPEQGDWRVFLVVGLAREDLEARFVHVELGAVRTSALAMPYESELSVWICRGPRVSPAQLRRDARFFI